MAISTSRLAAALIILSTAILTGCADTSVKAGPELGNESRPTAAAAAITATSLADNTVGMFPAATRNLDACSVEPLGSISNPDAPRRYSCSLYRVTLVTFAPALEASAAALLLDQEFAARSCVALWPLTSVDRQPALEALRTGSAAPPVEGGYDCSGEQVMVTLGRADNTIIRTLAQTPPSPLSNTVVTDEPPIGLVPLDEVLKSDEVLVSFIETTVRYVDVTVCGKLRLC